MPAHRTARWTAAETAILQTQYPEMGIDLAEQLPGRSWHSIYVKAHKLGLKSGKVTAAPKPRLSGPDLEEAIRLREGEGWSFARIGAKFGVAEASANNAVLIALCTRRGFKPAERDQHGRLTAQGLERVRYALKKGLKGVDIQLRLGVSASCVAEQRRRYNRELLERGKALLPPPGAGEAYSGVKLSKAKKAEVERLFLDGLGTAKVAERSGVSKTSCTRIRNRLIKRLKRKGETLAGCDAAGVRHVQAESTRFITDAQRDALRSMLLERIPVSRAARIVAIGGSSAYRIRDELAAELAAAGRCLPPPARPGRVRPNAFVQSHWPPNGAAEIYAFRQLLRDLPFEDAKVAWRRRKQEAARIEAQRPKSFEEQLAMVAAGKLKLSTSLSRAHLEPQYREERRAGA
jgi:DNA-directed RNA polymerase specialized sigma24 family protein